jgi:hypothetical protein
MYEQCGQVKAGEDSFNTCNKWILRRYRNSVGVGIFKSYSDYANGWVTGKLWLNSRQGVKNLSILNIVQTGTGTHSAWYSVDKRALSPVLRRPGREDDYSPPFGVKVMNAWSYTSAPQYAYMASTVTTSFSLHLKNAIHRKCILKIYVFDCSTFVHFLLCLLRYTHSPC